MYKIARPSLFSHLVARFISAAFNYIKCLFVKTRYIIISRQLRHIGDGVVFDDDIYINKPENIIIGDETYIGKGAFLNAYAEISIGRYCGVAAGCRLITWNHRIDNKCLELKHTGKKAEPIYIGDGVWLGYNVIVLPGVTIGNGAVVAAGAVVTKDVGSFDIVAGVPACVIGKRTGDSSACR